MSMFKLTACAVLLPLVCTAPAFAGDTPNLGKLLSEADITPWDISVMPDGSNLPPGSGTAAQGANRAQSSSHLIFVVFKFAMGEAN